MHRISSINIYRVLGSVVVGISLSFLISKIAIKAIKNISIDYLKRKFVMLCTPYKTTTAELNPVLDKKQTSTTAKTRFYSCIFFCCINEHQIFQESMQYEITKLQAELNEKQEKIASFEKFIVSHPDLITEFSESWKKFKPNLINKVSSELMNRKVTDTVEEDAKLINEITKLRFQIHDCDVTISNYAEFVKSDKKIIEALERVIKSSSHLALSHA